MRATIETRLVSSSIERRVRAESCLDTDSELHTCWLTEHTRAPEMAGLVSWLYGENLYL